MLNRRILRVKAMQALYSYHVAQESLKKVIQQELESHYYPDPAKDDFTESDVFTARRKAAARIYHEFLESRKVVATEAVDEDIAENVQSHINKYYTEIDKELRKTESQMIGDLEQLEQLYLQLVQLLVEISHLEQSEKEKKERAHVIKASSWAYHFISNPLVDDLTKHEPFNKGLIEHKVSWAEHSDKIKTWYKDILQKDEVLIEYQKKAKPGIEDHKQAVLHLFKKIVFKNEVIDDYLSSIDLHWSENKAILKSLVVKTFQDYEADLDEPYALKEVSRNAEEDIDFFKKLFKQSVRKEKELDEIIAKKTKNWDFSRVALMDRIILRMALTEAMTFHSIPVKVTINEFIEISKNYSTPKSKQFINGILDVLVNQLTSEGVIKKSGRGLIDNK